MKTLSAILLLIFLGATTVSYAQNLSTSDPRVQKNIKDYNPQKPVEMTTYQPPYFIETKKLALFFKSGTIPASFPKYNYNLSKQSNGDLVRSWLNNQDNYNLLTDEGKAKIEEAKSKKQAK